MFESCKVVRVTFNKDNVSRYAGSACREYDYFTDLDLKVGDKAVVFVNTAADGGYKVVTVEAVDVCSSKATKWIVSKVDLEGYKSREAARKEMTKIERELASKVEAARRRIEAADLLKGDEEAEKLLERLIELKKSV